MSKLSKENIDELSKLCRISCNDEEKAVLSKNMSKILDYMDQLSEVDTDDVSPCNHVLAEVVNVLREDEPGEPLDTQTFLANSPSHVGSLLRVPPVIKF